MASMLPNPDGDDAMYRWPTAQEQARAVAWLASLVRQHHPLLILWFQGNSFHIQIREASQ